MEQLFDYIKYKILYHSEDKNPNEYFENDAIAFQWGTIRNSIYDMEIEKNKNIYRIKIYFGLKPVYYYNIEEHDIYNFIDWLFVNINTYLYYISYSKRC